MKLRRLILIIFLHTAFLQNSFAWGPEGHAIIARLAMRFVKDDVKKNILSILGEMPIDTAANWMDIMRSKSDYDFMRPWHFINYPKEKVYQESNKENILNQLLITYNELSHKKTLCEDQIKTDLLVLLHLMGDLHMPLHAGYEEDLGGNKQIVQYESLKSHNLHTFWDEDIIRLTKITEEDCYQYLKTNENDPGKEIDFLAWMQESRKFLGFVYDFPDFTLDKNYLQKSKVIVEKQLLKAGQRLALILNKIFYTPDPVMDFKVVTAGYKNGIGIKDAQKNIGKKVTICSRVVSIRYTSGITQISLEEKFPNSPLTVVVFGKSYPNFSLPLDELLKDKNVCIRGTIEEYKGNAQIIVDNASDIIIY